MKIQKLFFLSLFSLTLVYSPVFAGAESLNILYPPSESYVQEGNISLVLKFQENSTDSIQISSGEFTYPDFPVEAGNKFFCTTVTLSYGLNKIKVTGKKGDSVTGTKELEIYFVTDLNLEYNKAPRDFVRYYFHDNSKKAECTACHNLTTEPDGFDSDNPSSFPCYSCHKNKLEFRFVHQPASEWACTDCHLVEEGTRTFEVPRPIAETTCSYCHDEISEWQELEYMHGPTAVGACTACHDPHSSDWPALTYLFTTDLCISCHAEFSSGKHVLAGFGGRRKGHPVRGVPDMKDPEKEFSCAGCHNPHASESRGILNFKRDRFGFFCKNCHKK